MKTICLFECLVIAMCASVTGCSVKPNLTVHKLTGQSEYAIVDGSKKTVAFTVKNMGGERAPNSIATVEFDGRDPIEIEIPALDPLQSYDVVGIPFPNACFISDCNITIAVDTRNVVDESTEEDNTVDATIIG